MIVILRRGIPQRLGAMLKLIVLEIPGIVPYRKIIGNILRSRFWEFLIYHILRENPKGSVIYREYMYNTVSKIPPCRWGYKIE